MLVIHSVEACRRGLDATMWRLDKGNLHCDRCRRKKGLPQRRRSPVHLAALFGLLVIVAAWVAFAFAESGHQREIDQALEPVLEEQSGMDDKATGADDSLYEITASIGQPGLEGRLKSTRHSDGLLTLDVSMREFVELQRLDDNGRRFLLGLPAHCNPGITAMMAPTSTVRRLVALITCTGSLHR